MTEATRKQVKMVVTVSVDKSTPTPKARQMVKAAIAHLAETESSYDFKLRSIRPYKFNPWEDKR